jgi:endonuclease/exonuclease/phosphatase (EEP) superfamily protein YafD
MLLSAAMAQKLQKSIQKTLTALAWFYSFALLSWFLLYLLFGDGTGFLGLANALSIYFFVPLPFIALFAWSSKQTRLWWPTSLGLLIFASLWGPHFTSIANIASDQPSLRVMSFNVLGRAGSHQPILDSIFAEEADVLLLQEVTTELSTILTLELSAEFPYQILQPARQASGMAVLSRYPITPLDVSIPGNWIGTPQILSLDWQGTDVTLVNFHTLPTGTLWPRWVRRSFEYREADLQSLANFAATQSQFGPVILAGDANVTHLNDAYKSLSAQMQDVWIEAGAGLGHTFPGPIEEDNTYASISFFRIPYWLVRIDYIFASDHWQPNSTWLAEFNGGSDHRGVVTELVLLD